MIKALANVFDALPPDAWATYITAVVVTSLGIWQFKRTYRLNKQSAVFDKLADQLDATKKTFFDTNTSINSVINLMAQAANSISHYSEMTDAVQIQNETNRRLNAASMIYDAMGDHLQNIFGSYDKILNLMTEIERSTLISDKSRQAARYLYFTATEQHHLVTTIREVLQSIDMVPSSGDTATISPATFNKLLELISLVNHRSDQIRDYLDDLRVILHNDLVSKLYHKAKFGVTSDSHLTIDGIIDKRVEKSLN